MLVLTSQLHDAVVLYTAYFGTLYLQSRIPVVVDPPKPDGSSEDRPPSVLPLMNPEMAHWRPPAPSSVSSSSSTSESDLAQKSRVDHTRPQARLPQRQITLPPYSQPSSNSGPQRYKTLPERRAMMLTVSAPLASQDQSRPIPLFSSDSQSGVAG